MKSYKFRIYPNNKHKDIIHKTFGSTRFLYNKMLEERLYQKEKHTEKEFKQEYPWLKEVDSIALQRVTKNIILAYKRFSKLKRTLRKSVIRKLASGDLKKEDLTIQDFKGYPRFKSKHYSKKSYKALNVNNNIKINFKSRHIKLPKLMPMKFRDDRVFKDKIKSITISQTSTGKYYASILVDEINESLTRSPNKILGLDYDSKNLFTDNQGNKAGYPRFYRKYEIRLKHLQRRLSKKQKGSQNRNKARLRLAKVHEKISNSRKDFHHKLSLNLIKEYDVICIEDMDMRSLSQCLRLGKSTLDNAWGYFRLMLEYKAKWYGSQIIYADKWFPSSKLCSSCQYKNKDLKLSDRSWICPECGVVHDRDVNAGINLRHYAIHTVGTTGF